MYFNYFTVEIVIMIPQECCIFLNEHTEYQNLGVGKLFSMLCTFHCFFNYCIFLLNNSLFLNFQNLKMAMSKQVSTVCLSGISHCSGFEDQSSDYPIKLCLD